MKKILNNRRLMLAVLAVIILVIVGIFVTSRNFSNSRQSASSSAVNVTVQQVQQKTIPIIIHAIGSLHAKQAVEISPQVAGQVQAISFKYGATVKAGQSLYELDKQLYEAQYQATKSDLHLSQRTYQRTQQLAKKHYVSQQDLDRARSDYQDKLSALNAMQVRLKKMTIYAPFSGVIGASKVDVGQFVATGKALVQLVDKASLTVRFSVPEQYLNQLLTGQAITITGSAFPGQLFRGKVSFVSPTVDPASRTVIVWGEINNSKLQLAPGLFVHVNLTIGTEPHALLIPQQALMPTISGNNVFIVQHGKAYQRAVTIGQMFGNQVRIKKGLRLGETVVTLGQEKLSNGRIVRVVTK